MLCSNIEPFFVFIYLAWLPFSIGILTKDHKLGKNNNLDFVDNINVTQAGSVRGSLGQLIYFVDLNL